MKDWDDLRFFLAVARKGSIRGAAALLGVNHSTVSRRIDVYEKRLGTRLFERLPSGYFVTQAGEAMRRSAELIETEVDTIDRHVIGGDARLSGVLRVTLTESMAQKLLMPDLVEFTKAHPAIELDLITTNSTANLARREADVAIRVSNDPPDSLVGRRILKFALANYASVDYLDRHDMSKPGNNITWIGAGDPVPDPQWVRDSPYPGVPARNHAHHPLIQLEAAKAGMGMAILPCFLGDTEPGLRRVRPASTISGQDIWLLTHEDLRHTARVRLFIDLIAKAILAKKDLLEGQCPQ